MAKNGKGGEEGEGSSSESGAAVTPFQLAMEHVHQVSSLLDDQKRNSTAADDESSENDRKRDSFIIRGGCPFRSFHKEHPTRNTSKHLTRAMEDFSLAAIMGRMASESFGDYQELELDRSQDEEENDETSTTAEEQVAVSTDIDNEQQKDDSLPEQQKEVKRTSFSQALKTGTAESHTAAENVHFVNNFIKGIIDRELYMDLLTGLYHTYITLEALLEEHAPTHFPTLHFPKELSRTEALKEDMEYWHGLNWENKLECRTPSPAVQDYMDRMEEVGRIDPLLLLSHAYTRYLGDLSGGKVLSRIARRALNLSRGYDGLQFYNFDDIKSAKLFKDKYRQALDELVLESDQVGRLVAEANVAFALNMRVFEELDVKGGVVGARVRNVREALSYYDVEMEEQKKGNRRDRSESFSVKEGASEEEAKCPFGFKGGSNPHGPSVSSTSKEAADDAKVAVKEQDAPLTSSSASGAMLRKETTSTGGGRCPWPFVFFHDPLMGMRDWQTFFVIGLVLCWCWSRANASGIVQ
mmetsp:Transcript_15563/g.25258  ORF Transcript_15563/g.25258 Transcript_15563/m.25258 type:complete len:524 (-) Transcript_15563:52-1623(-)